MSLIKWTDTGLSHKALAYWEITSTYLKRGLTRVPVSVFIYKCYVQGELVWSQGMRG